MNLIYLPFPRVVRGSRRSEVWLAVKCALAYVGVLAYSAGCWYGVFWAIRAVV